MENKPLIAQSDQTLLLDTHAPGFEAARAELSAFATLEKSPEHFHTYRLDALSLWNAASAGLGPEALMDTVRRYSRYDLPPALEPFVRETMSRFGATVLTAVESPDGAAGAQANRLRLSCRDPFVRAEIAGSRRLASFLHQDGDGFLLALTDRGNVKRELARLGWPALDEAPVVDGAPFPLALQQVRPGGAAFGLRG